MAKNEVRGRLNREPNPLPGAQPGYNPQFYDLQGYAVDVDESNPYPSANYVQNDAGIWMPVSKDNPVPTQLTGSNVEYDKKTRFINRAGVIAPGITETILETRKPVLIHEFTAFFDIDEPSFRLEMEVFNGTTFNYYELSTSPTGKGRAIIPSRAEFSSLFEKVQELEVVKLSRPFELRGIRFKLVNVTSSDRNASVSITYSEVD